MEKRIICINQYPLNPRSKRLSYVDAFLKTGIKFEYWDTTQYFSMSNATVDCQEEAYYVRKFSTLGEIMDELDSFDCKHSIFFNGVPITFEYRAFFKAFIERGCTLLRVDPCSNTLPIKKNFLDVISFITSPSRVLAHMKRKAMSLYCDYHDIHYTDIFTSSRASDRTRAINHPDYDDYNRAIAAKNTRLVKNKYALFYDSFFPLHPDFKYIHKLKMNIDYKHYLNSMNAFFEWIEKKKQLEVVIAAHPISNYAEGDFNGRKIIKWHTCELTLDAAFVINQTSNSTSFAVLANKPIIFITCDDVEKCRYMSRYISTLSGYLGKNKYNIDHDAFEDIDISPVEQQKRMNYIYSFLTDKTTENKTNGEIFTEYVKSHIG